MNRILGSILYGILALGAAAALAQGPPGDYGEAPAGSPGTLEAYPGVPGRFVSFYSHTATVFSPQHNAGTWLHPGAFFWLGEQPPGLENGSGQNPGDPDNDSDPVILLEGLGPNPLATLLLQVTTGDGHDFSSPVYLNVFVDQNRDGQWKDGFFLATPLAAWNGEWVVRDLELSLQPGQTTEVSAGQIRLENPTRSHWVRVVLTDRRVGEMLRPRPAQGEGFWDATMPASHDVRGEVEDFLLEFFADPSLMARGGIALRGAFEDDPPPGRLKPECHLILRRIDQPPPPGVPFFLPQPFVLRTDWCPGGTDFGLEFKVNDVLGGCADADALIGISRPRYVSGVNVPPILPMGLNGPGQLQCPDGSVLDLPPGPPWNPPFDQGVVPVASLRQPATRWWRACYPAPSRFRLFASRVHARTCGCEIQSYVLVSPPPYDHDPATTSGVGGEQEIYFINGDLIERFVDPVDERPFPDPDFTEYSVALLDQPQFGAVGQLSSSQSQVGVPDHSPPSSFRLKLARYVVRPAVPAGARTRQLSFWHLGEGLFEVILRSAGGQTLGKGFTPGSFTGWRQEVFDLPAGFLLKEVEISMLDGFLDDVVVSLEPLPADSDGDGVSDEDEIAGGSESDCDEDGVPDSSQLADDDCDGNGKLDRCEIAGGLAADVDGDGAPDHCLPPDTGSQCVPGDTALCLSNDRFRVESEWRTPGGPTTPGHAVELTGDTGYFWFFHPDNVEAVVKVLDACSPPFERFWVFAAGLTDVEVTLTVTDTASGESKRYVNPAGERFRPIQDTDAFDTCR